MIWEYDELFDAFNEVYGQYILQNMSSRESLSRAFDEFESVIELGDMEKAIVNVAYGELLLIQTRILDKNKIFTIEDLNSVNMDSLKEILTLEQYNNLSKRKENVLEKLQEKELDFYPIVRWYYNELTKTVDKYYRDNDFENKSIEYILEDVLKRFNRDCENTSGESITVKVTIAELLLLNKGIDAVEYLQELKQEITNFRIEELDYQFTKLEILNLKQRLKALLEKL